MLNIYSSIFEEQQKEWRDAWQDTFCEEPTKSLHQDIDNESLC